MCHLIRLFFISILTVSLILVPKFALAKKPDGMPPPMVEVQPAKYQNWQAEINAIGTLSANQGVTIKPEMNGRVTAVYFRSGDYVKANAALLQINPDILQAQFNSAEAKVTLSKANYERAKILFQKHVFAQADLDNSLSAYQSDLANAAEAQAQLNQTIIRAPFAGRIGLRMVNLGDYLTSGNSTVTNLQDLDPMRIDFSVPEIFLGQIAVGQTVLIHSKDFPNQMFHGTVYACDSTIDPNTRTLAIRASIPNKDYKLLPGSFVEVQLMTGKPQNFVTVPETALGYNSDGDYVYKVLNNMAIKTKVITGQHKDNEVAILNGINKGDVIVTAGQFKITTDTSPVMISK
jgi:membrane fusion protein (multidrug efflux system)